MLAGETGQLVWNGRWISFLDTLMQIQILSMPGRSLRLPTRIKSVKIDPKAHPPMPIEDEESSSKFLAFVFKCIGIKGGYLF